MKQQQLMDHRSLMEKIWWRRSEVLHWEKWEKKGEFLNSVESSIPDSWIFPDGYHTSGSSHGFRIPKEWSQHPKPQGWALEQHYPLPLQGGFAQTTWLPRLGNISYRTICSAKKARRDSGMGAWKTSGDQTQSKDTSVCFPPICVQGLAGGGGHCEPTHVPVSGSWSCCSHPRWLNALFNSFLNIPRSAVIWRRIRCVTTGKLEKILSSVSLPPLDLSPCSDYCPPAALIKAHKKHREWDPGIFFSLAGSSRFTRKCPLGQTQINTHSECKPPQKPYRPKQCKEDINCFEMFHFYAIKMWLLAFCFAELLFLFRKDGDGMGEGAEEEFYKILSLSTPS